MKGGKKVSDINENTVEEAVETEAVVEEMAEEDVEVVEEATEEENVDKKDKKDIIIDELTDKYKRTFAEFDNFRKRSEKEKAAMFEIGAKSVIEKVLPIIDNFERGMTTLTEEEKTSPFAEGMDKIYKQLIGTLEEIGVKPIETEGQEFNHDFHNAVMHVEDDSVGENVIIEEFQKGYTYRDSVVRHSMVKVAN